MNITTSKVYDVMGGIRVHQTTTHCVRETLTDEVRDLCVESVRDHFMPYIGDKFIHAVVNQVAIIDYVRYYLDDCLRDQAENYQIIADNRNNDVTQFGKTFNIDVTFRVRGSLIDTKIRNTIHYVIG